MVRLDEVQRSHRDLSSSGESDFFPPAFQDEPFKIIIQKGDMPDDPKAVCKDCKFISIAEMPVDVLLFSIRAGSCLRGHQSISHLK